MIIMIHCYYYNEYQTRNIQIAYRNPCIITSSIEGACSECLLERFNITHTTIITYPLILLSLCTHTGISTALRMLYMSLFCSTSRIILFLVPSRGCQVPCERGKIIVKRNVTGSKSREVRGLS